MPKIHRTNDNWVLCFFNMLNIRKPGTHSGNKECRRNEDIIESFLVDNHDCFIGVMSTG